MGNGRTTGNQANHDMLVYQMSLVYRDQGCVEMRADIEGFEQPDIIDCDYDNHRPDLTCRNPNGKVIILEAETESTINDAHTASQWVCFSQEANRLEGEFHVVVPNGCFEMAIDRLDELDCHYYREHVHELTV